MKNFNFSGNSLIVETNGLEETLEYIKKEKIENLYISRFHGYKLHHIKPLLKLKGIKQFYYQESDPQIDLSGLENFSEIERLRIDGKQRVNLGAFPNLKFLNTSWSKKLINFDKCENLTELCLWYFNTKEKDFSNFPFLKSLSILNLFWGNAENLNGLEFSNQIREINIHLYPKLTTIEKLLNSKTIQKLDFENCKRVADYHLLSNLKDLKSLMIRSCGELDNLDFIRGFENLEQFNFFETNIKDGNLGILEEKKIKNIWFNNKKHYSHSLYDFSTPNSSL